MHATSLDKGKTMVNSLKQVHTSTPAKSPSSNSTNAPMPMVFSVVQVGRGVKDSQIMNAKLVKETPEVSNNPNKICPPK